MNFFVLGYAFVNLPLGFNSIVCYAVKFLGFLFMFLGIVEISGQTSNFKGLKLPAWIGLGVLGLCTAVETLVIVFKAGATVLNIAGIVLGIVSTLTVVFFCKKLLELIRENNNLVNDNSNITRFYGSWNKLVVFTGINLVFDILNRVISFVKIQDFAGFVAVITKIIMIVFVIMTVLQFNKIRVDFNKKHSLTSMFDDE